MPLTTSQCHTIAMQLISWTQVLFSPPRNSLKESLFAECRFPQTFGEVWSNFWSERCWQAIWAFDSNDSSLKFRLKLFGQVGRVKIGHLMIGVSFYEIMSIWISTKNYSRENSNEELHTGTWPNVTRSLGSSRASKNAAISRDIRLHRPACVNTNWLNTVHLKSRQLCLRIMLGMMHSNLALNDALNDALGDAIHSHQVHVRLIIGHWISGTDQVLSIKFIKFIDKSYQVTLFFEEDSVWGSFRMNLFGRFWKDPNLL